MDEKMLKAGGEAKRRELITQFEEMSLSDNQAKYSAEDQFKAVNGDIGQGENMTAAKAARQLGRK